MAGEVWNAASGQPLPRALVKLGDGDAIGALTDGEGRFEIPGVPSGLTTFLVVKPGFRAESSIGGSVNPHLVLVAPNMPPLRFAMVPDNALQGRVELASGDPAANIGITLLKLSVEDGRSSWTEAGERQTDAEGNYRFAGLEDGSYLVKTQAAFENDAAAPTGQSGRAQPDQRGYPIVFYSNAFDAAGATRINLSRGQRAQANMILAVVPFHAVEATLARPPGGARWQFLPALKDRVGQKMDYPLAYEEKSRTVRGFLPDGSYSLIVSGSSEEGAERGDLPLSQPATPARAVAGLLDFTVAGRPETSLRVPLSTGVSTPIHLRYEPSAPVSRQVRDERGEVAPEPPPLGVWIKRAGGVAGGAENQQTANWVDADLFELGAVAPGTYWVQASANRSGTCLGAVTSGGANLGRVPLIVGASGAGPSIEVVLRTDCARLNLQLPASLAAATAGEEQAYSVYLVPEFDSVASAATVTLWPATSGAATLEDLTPGPYRVLTFLSPRTLEYHNPSAMEAYAGKGQEVILGPGATAGLLLEAPDR